jgi:glutamate racemase
MAERPRILVFDSGMGGLTVARALSQQMPQADLIYAADNAAFPYGAWKESELITRIVMVLGHLIETAKPDVAVVACNTASTIALAELRATYKLPFVGTVPAIKHGRPRVYARTDPHLRLSLQGAAAWRTPPC